MAILSIRRILNLTNEVACMHRHALTLLTASLLASPLLAAAPKDGWYRNLNEARKAASDSDRPLFVVFRCET
ncbi:MAG: hypothetical protein VX311_01215 [Planctomycetota bacterium]|nr:hypothetical protein [Planctomycetota bacterium]MEE3283174.1 hypothetical protein [Planctomycetota bacterium]MEE3365022.1 hypothetical protein [Planctomycetota bacterium]